MKNLSFDLVDCVPYQTCKYCRQRFYYDTSRYLIHLRRHENWMRPYFKKAVPRSSSARTCQKPSSKQTVHKTKTSSKKLQQGQSFHNSLSSSLKIRKTACLLPKVLDRLPSHKCKYCRQIFYYNTSRYLIHLRRHENWIYPNQHNLFRRAVARIPTLPRAKSSNSHTVNKDTKECQKSATTVNKAGATVVDTVQTKETPYQCQYCNRYFSQMTLKTSHEQLYHSYWNRINQNKQKNVSTISSNETVTAMTRPTDEEKYKCKSCNKTFSEVSARDDHERLHTKLTSYQCRYCSVSFARASNQELHEKVFHKGKEKPIQCKYCNQSFSWSNYKTQDEDGVKSYQCKFCLKTFKLGSAKRIPPQENPHHSQHRFVDGAGHEMVYKKSKNRYVYKCKYCDACFNYAPLKIEHETSHKCSYCSVIFTDPKDISRHERAFHPDYSDQCEHCRKSFKTGKLKWEHVKTNHRCSYCGSIFEDPKVKNRHERDHHAPVPILPKAQPILPKAQPILPKLQPILPKAQPIPAGTIQVLPQRRTGPVPILPKKN